ncbi:hypothetical protein pdam_00000290 [Pocillopora damicornis]|uniref:Cytochrome b-c1 complex subunit 9 n=1 Tax=Pocillopora damicornis TaxID=46731 RepID=A0A3M6UJ52_POCDA|nr:hypothetical protein pdam_00000290 [Pocillopora damicornis]
MFTSDVTISGSSSQYTGSAQSFHNVSAKSLNASRRNSNDGKDGEYWRQNDVISHRSFHTPNVNLTIILCKIKVQQPPSSYVKSRFKLLTVQDSRVTMSIGRTVYNALFRRTSTFAVTIFVGAFAFERIFDVGMDNLWETMNRGGFDGSIEISHSTNITAAISCNSKAVLFMTICLFETKGFPLSCGLMSVVNMSASDNFCADSIGKLWKKLASNGVSVVVWCFKENLWLSHLRVREVEIGNTY